MGTIIKHVLLLPAFVTDSACCLLCREQMKSSDIDQELFTESYCKVCSAQLISESQRVAHYEVGCLWYLCWSVTPPLLPLQPRVLQVTAAAPFPASGYSGFLSENSKFKTLFLLVASCSVSDGTATLSAARLVFPSV